MIADALVQWYPLTALLWALVYSSDYAWTLAVARRWDAVRAHVAIEGSYEVTPLFRDDIDGLRRVSPRFVAMLVGTTSLLLALGYLSRSAGWPGLFSAAAGGMFLLEAAVHLRHFRNGAVARLIARPGAATGQIRHPRWYSLQLSAWELASVALVYTIAAVVLGSWGFAFGAALCLRTAADHYRMSLRP